MAEKSGKTFGAIAQRLADNGYEPVPIIRGEKRPPMANWQVGGWEKHADKYDKNFTGLLTRTTPSIDIDVTDEELVMAIRAIVFDVLDCHEVLPPRRVGNAPRELLVFRTEEPFQKLTTAAYVLKTDTPDASGKNKGSRVEILADGQQFVAYAVHPITKKPYYWNGGGDPLVTPRSRLLVLDEYQAKEIIRRCEVLLSMHGTLAERRAMPTSPLAERISSDRQEADDPILAMAALGAMPNPDLAFDDWLRILYAAKGALGDAGRNAFMRWSARSVKHDQAFADKEWAKAKPTRIGAGTLIWYARKMGWSPDAPLLKPTLTIDPETGEIVNSSPLERLDELFWKPRDIDFSKLQGIDYIIDGFLAESFSVFAGQPGIGKTTAFVPLTLIAAGFKVGSMTTQDPRKIIYVSEDPEQVVRILHAFIRFEGLDAKRIKEQFHLIDARRVTAPQLAELHKNVTLATTNGVKPWVVIDTASATMDIRDENDNSGVAQFVAAVKEIIYVKQKAPVSVITHTAKALGRNDEDATARGASAWEGDATLTATMFMENGQRFIKLRKTRYEPDIREIKLATRQNIVAVTDKKGRMQDMTLTWTVPEVSSEAGRRDAAEQEKGIKKRSVVDLCHTEFLAYASQLVNPVIYVGKGNHKVPEGCARVSVHDWIEDCGVAGAGNRDDKRDVAKAIIERLGGGQMTGWLHL